MFRRSLIIPFMLGAMPVVAAAWVWSPAILATVTETKPAQQKDGQKEAAPRLPDLDALKPREGTAESAAFDVARVDPNGWSVFAGTAPAHSSVTVTADGVPVGTAKADERGEWSLLTDHHIARDDPVLGLATEFGQPAQKPVASARAAEPSPAASDVDPSRRMMRDFEDLVAAARNPQTGDRTQQAVHAPVPIPIQFVFRRAEFTDEGRKAAELLSEYLALRKPESIVLTGHADERGSEVFNVILSRRRLEAVADFLRQNGYGGRLVLIPKGSSEPYKGVDRASLDRRTRWQLDRRVELELGTEAQTRLGSAAADSERP